MGNVSNVAREREGRAEANVRLVIEKKVVQDITDLTKEVGLDAKERIRCNRKIDRSEKAKRKGKVAIHHFKDGKEEDVL